MEIEGQWNKVQNIGIIETTIKQKTSYIIIMQLVLIIYTLSLPANLYRHLLQTGASRETFAKLLYLS